MVRKCIGLQEKFTGYMDHFQVKICEIKEPVGLTTVKILRGTEAGKVFMVSKDLNRETVEIMLPGL